MTDQPLRGKNHYVPCMYLKQWALSNGHVWTYRTLVSASKVQPWKRNTPKGVAYHQHLYTRVVASVETDAFERWLNTEIETPAAEAIEKAISGVRLTPNDWNRLVRFLAAQQVRTPQWFLERAVQWNTVLVDQIKETLGSLGQQFKEEIARDGQLQPASTLGDRTDIHDIPIRISVKGEPEQKRLQLGAEILVGRSLWLWHMRSALNHVAQALYHHRWTILLSPEHMAWFTSDDPVIRLNFGSPTEYNFGGGWGSPGTQIFLPLGPQHLLYTQVGERHLPWPGERVSHEFARLVRRCIAERAYLMIFAAEKDADVPTLRPRQEDAEAYQREQERWSKWRHQQATAEREWESPEHGEKVS